MTFRASIRSDIKPEWGKAVQEGRKTIDVRLNAQPYADVNKGDIIEYRSTKVRVKKIRAYPGLNDLLAHEDFKKIVPEAGDGNDALKIMLEDLHLHQGEPRHGVLAFEIELEG